jgi:hypothetical protein
MIGVALLVSGCVLTQGGPDRSFTSSYPLTEPQWIRDGQPIDFEGALWYPTDNVEGILDTEVYQAGEFKGEQYYLDKTDVKPFDRLYTRFAKNRYRAFEKEHDPKSFRGNRHEGQ